MSCTTIPPPLSAGFNTKSLSSSNIVRAFFSLWDRLLETRKGCSFTFKTSCSTILQNVLIEWFDTFGQKLLFGLKWVTAEDPVMIGFLEKKCLILIWRKHLNKSTFRSKVLTLLKLEVLLILELQTKESPLDNTEVWSADSSFEDMLITVCWQHCVSRDGVLFLAERLPRLHPFFFDGGQFCVVALKKDGVRHVRDPSHCLCPWNRCPLMNHFGNDGVCGPGLSWLPGWRELVWWWQHPAAGCLLVVGWRRKAF